MMAAHQVERVSLAGYSMGGRVCLTVMELMPGKIESCVLIASDGLVFNPLYYFVTRTVLGKRIFRRFLTEPGRYLDLIEWLRRREIIHPSRYRFAMHYLESEADRNFLLNVWPAMCRIVPERRRLRASIRSFEIPVFIFMGMYDRVIPVPHGKRFQKNLPSVELIIVEKGHRVFDSSTLPKMAACLRKPGT
ncbi:MAG: alpha/beta hydrolase [Sphingobacteriales bacterium]|nr:MAG: alpha/beta hydrolase [Sphingobacteriales bacterium]